ncbi:MAG: DUF1501 domain-containing protein, partial [Acidobacteria bacterium]|nr:DUF1501 domain-containing protein [Acidobacteriota bacterium]
MNSIFSLYHRKEEPLTRRAWLRAAGLGFGSLSLSAILAEESKLFAGIQSKNPLIPRPPHFEPKAKRVIFLFMHGGPSSIDTFDPKERLSREHGKPLPIKRPLAFDKSDPGPLMKSPWEFKPGGKSAIPVSDLFPHVRECADDLCIIRSMVGEGVDHGAALLQTFTGTSTFIRPSLGSWVVYGLGTENQNLPGFIAIKPSLAHGGAKNWSSAFLPGAYQGTAIGHAGLKVDEIKNEPIEYLTNKRYTSEQQRYELDLLQNINRRHEELRKDDPQLEARIQAFELAFRMQADAPE